jgi:hypothetical protein
MGLTGLLVVTFVGILAICLICGWRVRGQSGAVSEGDWRVKLPTPGLWFATLSQLLACGFLVQGFRSDSQSFAEPAPLHWAVLNWVSVLAWGIALSTTVLGKRRLRLPLVFWVLSMPLAAWVVIMMGYDY